ncbi:MAG: hypothetical protein A3J63_01830 [Candidatus Moranbacteria bacterium RIFCSPHIGHO2_02_FULL_40_12b]|nr:MAG: hypothetical protein A3J63_01830 [Candidatus Moranbacteria bacterium RIFCSPHIGHO2_02_FULL_40_12b]OGI23467.1 MAG: hypothetical protein A3E91_01625 [Candidatus Moranbacteria bacterium RIFCSPHIGHO2_12_FULL_40_10]
MVIKALIIKNKNMKTKLKKTIHWLMKNIVTALFCLTAVSLGTAIVARATGGTTTIGADVSTTDLTADTATIGTLNGILKGTNGTVSAIAAGTSGQYLKGDGTWADLNQAADLLEISTTTNPPLLAIK